MFIEPLIYAMHCAKQYTHIFIYYIVTAGNTESLSNFPK